MDDDDIGQIDLPAAMDDLFRVLLKHEIPPAAAVILLNRVLAAILYDHADPGRLDVNLDRMADNIRDQIRRLAESDQTQIH